MRSTFGPARLAAFVLSAFLASAFASPELCAGGRRDVDTVTVEGEETWQNVFDVAEYPTGTHNFIVHARDRAGNVAVSGPYNLRVDPNAMLPVARIVHPEHGAVIRQNLNVIGVASGRYEVQRTMIRLNDDAERTVNGVDFWNSYFDFSRLPDGRHSLSVRAFDAGGLYGPVQTIDFILDRTPPAVELVSHEIGDTISGNVTVHGRVGDANGIRALYLSDDGESFRPLRLRGRRGADSLDFSFPIRTRDIPDGSTVFHLRAVDGTGLVTSVPVMFFVSNIPPELELLSPLPGEPLFNSFLLSGRAHSPVGIASVEYQWGRIRGEAEVRRGDPYWYAVLEHAPGAGNSITITATDNAGNVTRYVRRLDDRRRDMVPTVYIDYPPPETLANMPPNQAIYGRVELGFGPVELQLGEHSVRTFPAFRIDPSMIPAGRNVNFRIVPVDSAGVRGAVTALRVTSQVFEFGPPPAPAPSRLTVTSPELGGWVTAGGYLRLAGSAAPGTAVQFRLGPQEAAWRSLELDEYGGFDQDVSLVGWPAGPVHLELRTGNNFPVHHPFNLAPVASPRIRWVSPSVYPETARPRMVFGNRTVVGEVTHQVPIVSVAFAHQRDGLSPGDGDGSSGFGEEYGEEAGDGFTEIPFSSCGDRFWFSYFGDFTTLGELEAGLVFRIVDAAGGEFVASPGYVKDPDPPIPVIIVNSPLDGEIFTAPFEVSGIAFDEVGIRGVYWRLLGPTLESASPGEAGAEVREAALAFQENPDPEFVEFLTERSFGIPMDYMAIGDGEFLLEVFAADIYGVRSEVASRRIRISTSRPETVVLEPSLAEVNSGTVVIRGFTSDANGVAGVSFSMDGGNTWQEVDMAGRPANGADPDHGYGLTETFLEEDGHWSISLNTLVYTDGVNSAIIRAEDRYGVYSFTIAMINIDNTPPELSLSYPMNGQNVGADLRFVGRAVDNLGLDTLTFQVVSSENPEYRQEFEIRPESSVISFGDVSLEGFPMGNYVVRVIARDLAGNETIVSREITFGGDDAQIALFNPFPGETHSGPVGVIGTVTGASIPDRVTIMMDGSPVAIARVDRFGIFRHEIPESEMRDGQGHGISAYFYEAAGERISSPVHTVFFSRFGPVLTIDSHQDGDVITRRPWLSGRAWMSADDSAWQTEGYDRRERRAAERELALASVQVSYDNGHTFMEARNGRGDGDWRFRMETGELAAGHLPVLVRARFANGEQAVRRVMLYVDTTPPVVQTITPTEGSAHRENVLIYGTASDNNDLASVDISFRTGDKWLYSVPGFLRGAYIDVKALGATFVEVGVGLSFFDDNVRIQTQFGLAPPDVQSGLVYGGRFTGSVFGVRLLANIFNLPFSWVFGPDWTFFSMNIAVGANFSWFSMADEHDRGSLFMSAVIAQWDFVNVDMQELFPDWRFFRNFALYLQPELWFASAEAGAGASPQIFRMTFGLRTNIF